MRPLAMRRSLLVALVAAIAVGSALVAACGGLLQTALVLDAPPQRLARADLVITGGEHARLAAADGARAQTVTLSERAALPGDVVATVGAVDGVAHAVPRPELRAVAVTAARGVSIEALRRRVESRLADQGPVAVLTGDDRGRAEETGVAASRLKLILLASIFGGTALIVMAMLLASIAGLSVEQRRREIGLLRTIGATPRQVRRMIVAQIMRPAIPAALAGAVCGPVLARLLFDRVQDAGVVPQILTLRQGVVPVVAGVVSALLMTRASAALSARRAVGSRLAEAVGEAEAAPGALGPVRLGLAGLMAAGAVSCGVITTFMAPQNAAATGGGTALAGVIACALVAPRLAERGAAWLWEPARRLAGVPGHLAAVNVGARAHRTATLVTPILLVVALALANVYQQTTQADAMRSAYRDSVRADAVVTATHGSMPSGATTAARRVGATSSFVTSTGWIEHPADRAHRIDPRALIGVEGWAVASKVGSGSLRDLRGNAVALPKGVAEDLHRDVGDTIGMVLGDGAHVRLRIVALLEGSDRYGSLVLPPALLSAHVSAPDQARLLVRGPGDVRGRLADVLAQRPDVLVRGGDALLDDYETGLQVDAWIAYAVVGVIVAYAAMALITTLAAALRGRRRELVLLSLVGATRRQLLRMLQAEALMLAVIGAAAGTVVALAGLVPLSVATAGSPLPSGPIWLFPGVLAIATALVLVPTVAVAHTTLNTGKVHDVEAV